MRLSRPAFLSRKPTVAVIRLQGRIAAGARALDDATYGPAIEKAFASKPVAVALQINSPGGSPVQSSLIAGRIRRLAEDKKVPVLAFCEDVAASGGYWLATAADEIFVDPGSLVGSIGVISAGFGLEGTLDKIGAERRVHTAGRSKSFLDPFRPEKPEDVARLNRWLEQLHEVFIAQVKARRGDRLGDHPDLFTGEVWIGQHAVDVGLADGVGHLRDVIRARHGEDVKFKRFGPRRGLLARFGGGVVQDVLSQVEDRAAFARFGL